MQYRLSHLALIISFALVLYDCNRPSTPPIEPIKESSVVIISVNPLHGPGGADVTISGKGFSDTLTNDEVWFNGVLTPIIRAQTTELHVRVPYQAGTGQVMVSSNGVIAIGPVFRYDADPIDSAMVSTYAGTHIPGHQDGSAASATFGFVSDLAVDSMGNIFVADVNWNLIRKITPSGLVSTLAGAGSQPSSNGGGTFFYYPDGVAVGRNGNIYVADYGYNMIQVITAPETVTILAGAGTNGDADGIGTAAYFYLPERVVTDDSGNVFVADGGNNSIRKITPAGVVTTIAGGGTAQTGWADGIGRAARFASPRGIAIDHSGNLYVADYGNMKIRKITSAGVVTTLPGVFSVPEGVAVDSKGNVYVADTGNDKICKITPGGIVSTIAGTGVEGANDGPGLTATFKSPMGVVMHGDKIIYVADGSNHVIRKIVLQ